MKRPAHTERERVALLSSCACLLLVLAGCAAIRPAPRRRVEEMLPAEPEQWNRAVRFTRGPGAEFNGDWHPDGDALFFVSDREGSLDVFRKREVLTGLQPARPLARHAARERWPRVCPDGKRLVFVSTRRDSAGDLWLLSLRGWPFSGEPGRLTDADTADDQPCWHPDGGRILYASSPSVGVRYNIYQVKPGGKPTAVTTEGGQMPAVSPDGRFLAFISSRDGGNPDLYVRRLADGATTRLTEGSPVEMTPAWNGAGDTIWFTRIGLDTTGDGRLDRSDASSLFSVSFSEEAFAGRVPPARQLTSYALSEGFPRPLPGGLLFTREDERGNPDLYGLGPSGEVPEFSALSGYMSFARRAEQEAEDPHRRLLAWQNAAWASGSAEEGGDVAFDLPRWEEAAEAWLRMGETLLALGHPDAAKDWFDRLVEKFPRAHRWTGLAQLRVLELERRQLSGRREGSLNRWRELLERARELRDAFSGRALRARAEDSPKQAAALEGVVARAQLELGLLHLAGREPAPALRELTATWKEHPDHAGAAARALLAAGEIYEELGDSEAARDTYLQLLRRYPDQNRQAAQAARRIAEATAEGERLDQKLAALRGLIDRHPDLPALAALLNNRIGDLYYERAEHLKALEAYRRTTRHYRDQRRQAGAAYLAVARIQTDRRQYGDAIETLEEMRSAFGAEQPALYRRARRGFERALLRKADREMELGDLELALDTYHRLARFNAQLAAAHRGMVRAYARLDRVGEAILRYRPLLEQDPREHLAHYALALAYSYFGPADWVGDTDKTERRVEIDREALKLVGQAVLGGFEEPYYHQLRGFLLNRLAVATEKPGYRVQALNAYLEALGLADPARDPVNYANLLFNAGEGYMLVEQPAPAYEYYRRAMEAGFSFEGPAGGTALLNMSRSAMAAGDYPAAADLLERLLTRLAEIPSGERNLAWLTRRAQALDRLALAHRLDGDYAAAADHYRRNIAALRDLLEADPDGAAGYLRNLLRAERNLGVSLYMAVEAGQRPAGRLPEARELLAAALQKLGEVGVAGEETQQFGLVTIEVNVAIGSAAGSRRFDATAERRLLHTYLARTAAAAGNYRDAVDHLREKLALYPEEPGATGEVGVLTEKAVVLTQIARYRLDEGKLAAAAEAYRKAADLEAEAGNLRGEAEATVSLGRTLLRAREEGTVPQSELKAQVTARHEALISQTGGAGTERLAAVHAELVANLAALRTIATTGGEAE